MERKISAKRRNLEKKYKKNLEEEELMKQYVKNVKVHIG